MDIINQKDQLQWERYASISGNRYFQGLNQPLKSPQGNNGLTISVTVKDGDNNNITLNFEGGILVSVV